MADSRAADGDCRLRALTLRATKRASSASHADPDNDDMGPKNDPDVAVLLPNSGCEGDGPAVFNIEVHTGDRDGLDPSMAKAIENSVRVLKSNMT